MPCSMTDYFSTVLYEASAKSYWSWWISAGLYISRFVSDFWCRQPMSYFATSPYASHKSLCHLLSDFARHLENISHIDPGVHPPPRRSYAHDRIVKACVFVLRYMLLLYIVVNETTLFRLKYKVLYSGIPGSVQHCNQISMSHKHYNVIFCHNIVRL